MSSLIKLKTFQDNRGYLSVVDDREIPFQIKRFFYIYGVDNSKRAGHRHKITYQAMICIVGGCSVFVNNGSIKENYDLNGPWNCLLLEPTDWHLLYDFWPGTILLVFASEYFDPADYIYEGYE